MVLLNLNFFKNILYFFNLIIYLSKKLKAFTFDEIFLLAEMEKENLEKCLNELVEDETLKQDVKSKQTIVVFVI